MKFDLDEICDSQLFEVNAPIDIELQNVTVHYKFRAIGSSISNLEVAHEWLGIAFIQDRLSRFDKNMTYVREGGITFSLAINSNDWELFIKELKSLREWNDLGTFSELNLEFADFIARIGSIRSKTPDFVENYFANYICCGIHEEASLYEDSGAYLNETYKLHPEWEYDLWQCHKLGISNGDVLYSPYCWVINSAKKDHIFYTIYGYKPSFHLCLQREGILFTERSACRLSDIQNVGNAQTWVALKGCNLRSFEYLLSDDGDILVIDYGKLAIVYFEIHLIPNELLLSLYNTEQKSISTLAKLVRVRTSITYKWENLNDDTFQSLCLKLLSRTARFHDARIESVGKTRSRDGGRDFLAYTIERPGIPSMKYIIQCKYKKDCGSLSRSKMGDIGTTIGQYCADGYIIMTNGFMDATLIDSLEGFSHNLKFQTDMEIQYTKLQLEHLLDQHQDIALSFNLI